MITGQKCLDNVDIVFVDFDSTLLGALSMLSRAFKRVADTYQDPQHFLNNVRLYSKNTTIVLGQHFSGRDLKGTQIAAYLHDLGYIHLYLFSSHKFSKDKIPDYLIVFEKPDVRGIEHLLRDLPK